MSLRTKFFLVLLCGWGSCAPAYALPSVTILADPTMGAAMAEIARNYSREHGVVANTSFTPSIQQANEINEGSSADVLITPKTLWIEQLKTQGLIDVYSQMLVAKNRIALVGPIDSPIEPQDKAFPTVALINAMGTEQLFMVGNPETLAEGVYGKEALRSLDAAGDMEQYTLYVRQQEQMFDMVRKQHAYGLFFSSSTISHDGVRTIQLLPESSHHPIEYYAVAIAGENMAEARKFLEYLKSSGARKVLRESGFTVN